MYFGTLKFAFANFTIQPAIHGGEFLIGEMIKFHPCNFIILKFEA